MNSQMFEAVMYLNLNQWLWYEQPVSDAVYGVRVDGPTMRMEAHEETEEQKISCLV